MQLDSGTLIKFRSQAENVEVYENQQWKPFFVKGVNLGAALPGHDPGELPIDKKDIFEMVLPDPGHGGQYDSCVYYPEA